jgi:two-component system sensor histidine kinase CreC
MSDVNIQPKKSMEEPLVDTVNILASYLEQQVQNQTISTDHLGIFLDMAAQRRFKSRIYELEKTQVNLEVYVTDKTGVVIFDSNDGEFVGQDFSQRNDVYLTMRGKYGARTTRLDPEDPVSSVAYIAAPIYSKDEIIGVCTIAKPWKSINLFIDTTKKNILVAGIISFAAALVVSFFISYWITRPIRQLTAYSNSIIEGKRSPLPNLGSGEVKVLGRTFESMIESLEGKKYIENYVQTLTHQVKGPLSVIRGAAELLQEKIPEKERKKFISNINTESKRIQRIIDRMLELASLEQQRELRNVQNIDLSQMVMDIIEEMAPVIKQKEITLTLNVGKNLSLTGERFLIYLAVFNLIQNAVDFTPKQGTITVEIKKHWERLFLIVRDTGTGIPDYALEKVFDKFYSLQRPDSGKKSSGLGLSMVKEVAELHQGNIKIKRNTPKGTVAVLKLPISLPSG